MTLPELRRHVATLFGREGPLTGRDWESVADLEIRAEGGRWRVYDTERGETTEVHLDTESEADACACFLDLVHSRSYWLAGFAEPAGADRLGAALEMKGLAYSRNDLPEMGVAKRYRVFVRGQDMPKARAVVRAL